MSEPLDFSNRFVFVAGGSSGINLGIAHGFAAKGAKVCDRRRSQERVGRAVEELKAHGGDIAG